MYNGIGLASVRGSGTSGYVQANAFNLRGSRQQARERHDLKDLHDAPTARKANKDILEHNRKRAVEMKLLELREKLEEQGCTEGEVEAELGKQRAKLEREAAREAELDTCVLTRARGLCE